MIDLSKIELTNVFKSDDRQMPSGLRARLQLNVEIEYPEKIRRSREGITDSVIGEAKFKLLFRVFEILYGDLHAQYRTIQRHILTHKRISCAELEYELTKLESMLKFGDRWNNDFKTVNKEPML